MKKPLVILTGPTAVGKTELSIQLAKIINGSIISADSMQVYQYMDIGSAKVKKEEMMGVQHYLVDEFLPEDEFHVVKFQNYAKKYLNEIYEQGKLPIIVGGTGFYIQALLYDIDFTTQECDPAYRMKLESIVAEKGNEFLHEMLKKCDAKAASMIHPNNVKRIIRALEFFKESGQPISEHNKQEHAKKSPYNFCYFVLNDERENLYQRIDLRVDKMLEDGLIEEVVSLKNRGYHKDMVSMQGLGYKEILAYLNGTLSYEDAVYILKRDTRHFAKRQLTWFRREKEITWINKQDFSYDNAKIMQYITKQLYAKHIL